MIDELHVADLVLIRDASLTFAPGVTVLTGETGAGKTALLSALKLVIGERADASSVREGADAARVEARFFLREDDVDGRVVRRRVGADGRGRVDVDAQMASVHELAETFGATVDLCGQHEHQRLLDTSTHVELLDGWIGEAAHETHEAYKQCLAEAREAARELERIRELSRSDARALDEARFTLERIDEVDPKPDELAELEEVLPRAENAEALIRGSEEAREAIAGESGATDMLSEALSALRGAAALDATLEAYAEQLQSSLIDIEDVAHSLRDYRDTVDFDAETLERLEARMAALQGLMRTYGPSIEDVLSRREEAAELIAATDKSEEHIKAAEQALTEKEAALEQAAKALDHVRREGAPGLAQAICAQMARLEMGTAEVEVAFEELPRESWTEAGPARVELMYRPGAELSPRPLRRIASGGEVSRMMLAAKVVLGESDAVQTLVFDEVDAGVGGATATALAAVLKDLATTHQVIVVTHLAQVAVIADAHYVVSRTNDGVPETKLSPVEGEDRVREIARMLSGDATQASLDHAKEMLDAATKLRRTE